VIKSGLILTFFNVVAAVLGLVRNIMIARLLSVENFGIASTFALTMAFVDMSANIGIDRLIVQSKSGQDPRFQASLQSFQVLRGLLGGALLFASAWPLSQLFKTPDALWAYQAMAVIPVIRGFLNLDLNRFQKTRKFWPSIATETSAQAVSTVMALGLAAQGSDYRAMLYALIAQQVTATLLSNLFAERHFSFAWDSQVVRKALDFGWPLLLNGALLFGAFHGDRIIVANQLGPQKLGWFSVAYMLTLIPSTLLSKALSTLCLPVLAQHQDDEIKFNKLAVVVIEAACLISVFVLLGNALLGGPIVHLLFGAKHAEAITVLIPLAAMQAIRVAKAGPTIIAISKRQTTNPMWANSLRVAFLLPAFYVAVQTQNIKMVVWTAFAGELAGLLLSFYLLTRICKLESNRLFRIIVCLCAFVILPLLYDYFNPDQADALFHVAGVLLIGAAGVYIMSLQHILAWLWSRKFRKP
jgi:O-antigen/teichoic acid export membrane protein